MDCKIKNSVMFKMVQLNEQTSHQRTRNEKELYRGVTDNSDIQIN